MGTFAIANAFIRIVHPILCSLEFIYFNDTYLKSHPIMTPHTYNVNEYRLYVSIDIYCDDKDLEYLSQKTSYLALN